MTASKYMQIGTFVVCILHYSFPSDEAGDFLYLVYVLHFHIVNLSIKWGFVLNVACPTPTNLTTSYIL